MQTYWHYPTHDMPRWLGIKKKGEKTLSMAGAQGWKSTFRWKIEFPHFDLFCEKYVLLKGNQASGAKNAFVNMRGKFHGIRTPGWSSTGRSSRPSCPFSLGSPSFWVLGLCRPCGSFLTSYYWLTNAGKDCLFCELILVILHTCELILHTCEREGPEVGQHFPCGWVAVINESESESETWCLQ